MKLHLFQFTDEATAIADPTVGPYHNPGNGADIPASWRQDVCFPYEAVYVSQAPQSGFWIIIASADANTALASDANCRLAWDNENAVILGGTMTGNDMGVLYVTPVPAGAYNPWNGSPPASSGGGNGL